VRMRMRPGRRRLRRLWLQLLGVLGTLLDLERHGLGVCLLAGEGPIPSGSSLPVPGPRGVPIASTRDLVVAGFDQLGPASVGPWRRYAC
jgi:hypothetical protein